MNNSLINFILLHLVYIVFASDSGIVMSEASQVYSIAAQIFSMYHFNPNSVVLFYRAEFSGYTMSLVQD